MYAYQIHCSKPKSADQELWERTQNNSISRLVWARSNIGIENQGQRANALHILSTYNRYGWFVKQNAELADKYLEDAARLGHAQACYDIAMRVLENKDIEKALIFVKLGLENIDRPDFDCDKTGHIQKHMKRKLEDLQIVCAIKHSGVVGSRMFT